MHRPRILLLFGFESYLNNRTARLRYSHTCVDLVSSCYLGLKIIYIIVLHVYVTRIREPYIPLLLGFKSYLYHFAARLRNSLIYVDLTSPGYLGLKII